MEDQQWPAVEQTVLKSCENRLQDRYVSRANLYLGVSLFKQGRPTAARQAFINATLIGGANTQAAEWLQFMEAVPATEDELRRVRGPCYGSEGKKARLEPETVEASTTVAVIPDPDQSVESELGPGVEDVEIKTVPAARFYYSSHTGSLPELLPEVRNLAVRLNVTLVKAGASADGPLHILALPDEELRLALPVRGTPQVKGRYRLKSAGPFRCAWAVIDDSAEEVLESTLQFASRVEAAGYTLNGERRLIPRSGGVAGFEIQLGIE